VYLLLGVVFLLVSLAFTFATGNVSNLALLFAVALVWFRAWMMVHDWKAGNILEVPAYCVSVQPASSLPMSKNVSVLFTVDGMEEPTLNITVSGKGCKYISGVSYVLYLTKYDKSQVLAYVPVA
jgi:hypothetical protein